MEEKVSEQRKEQMVLDRAENIPDIIKKLDNFLNTYERVILVVDGESDSSIYFRLTWKFCSSEAMKEKKGRVLILSTSGMGIFENVSYRQITEAEEDTLIRLYGTYECSDRFTVLADFQCFGGIFRYVEIGILTIEEAFEAVLCLGSHIVKA